MQQAFFFLSLFLLDSQCTMLKHAHPLVPAMVEERTCPATKAEHTFFHCIILPLLRHPPAFSYVLGNPIFFAVRSGWKQAKHQLLSALPK